MLNRALLAVELWSDPETSIAIKPHVFLSVTESTSIRVRVVFNKGTFNGLFSENRLTVAEIRNADQLVL